MPQSLLKISTILVPICHTVYKDVGLPYTDEANDFEKAFLEWIITFETTDKKKFTHIVDWNTNKAFVDLKWMVTCFLIQKGDEYWSKPKDGPADPAKYVWPRDQTKLILLLRRLFQTYVVSGLPKFQTSLGQQGSLKDMFDNHACEAIRDLVLVEDKSSLSCDSDFECLGGNVDTKPSVQSQPIGSQDGHNSTASAAAIEHPEFSVKPEDGGTIDTFDIMQSDPGSEPLQMATNNSVFHNATRGKRATPSKRTGPWGKRRRVKKSSNNCSSFETDRPSDQQSVQRRSSGRLRRPTRSWNRASTVALREADPYIDGPDEAGESFKTIQQGSLLVVKSKKLQDKGRLLVHPEQEDNLNSVSVRGVTTATSTVINSGAADKGQSCSPPDVQRSTQNKSTSGRGVVRGLNPFELNSEESPIRFYVIDERGLKHRWLHNNPKLILETIQTMFDEISAYHGINSDNLEGLECKLITSQESIITFEGIVYPLERDMSHDIFEDMKVDVREHINKSRIEEPRCRCDINIVPTYSSRNKDQGHRFI